jgi:hypothetical protein
LTSRKATFTRMSKAKMTARIFSPPSALLLEFSVNGRKLFF